MRKNWGGFGNNTAPNSPTQRFFKNMKKYSRPYVSEIERDEVKELTIFAKCVLNSGRHVSILKPLDMVQEW